MSASRALLRNASLPVRSSLSTSSARQSPTLLIRIPPARIIAGRRRLIHTSSTISFPLPSTSNKMQSQNQDFTSDPLYTPTQPHLRPIPTSAISALAARLGLLKKGELLSQDLEEKVRRCLVDESWVVGTNQNLTRNPSKDQNSKGSTSSASSSSTTASTASNPNDSSPSLSPLLHSNSLLSALGNSILGLLSSESLLSTYPFLPTRAIKAAVSAHVGPKALVGLGRELGLGVSAFGAVGEVGGLEGNGDGLNAGGLIKGDGKRGGGAGLSSGGIPIRWMRGVVLGSENHSSRSAGALVPVGAEDGDIPGSGEEGSMVEAAVREGVKAGVTSRERQRRERDWEDVVAGAVRALLGLVYQEQGIHQLRNLTTTHLLSRHLDLSTILNFREPKKVLAGEVRRLIGGRREEGGGEVEVGLESRILAESGRLSLSPTFLIGIFLPSGLKLSEGSGSSLKMADHRACVNGLMSIYGVRGEKLIEAQAQAMTGKGSGMIGMQMPTSLHGNEERERGWRASVGLMGRGETLYGSGGERAKGKRIQSV